MTRTRPARAPLTLLLALTLALGALAAAPVPRARAAAFTVAVTMATDTANAACHGSAASPPAGTPCSLRDAVRFANGRAAADSTTITLPAGEYKLTALGSGEFSAVTGDLNIVRNVAIVGAGAATTIIDGQAADRIFTSFADVSVAISGVTLRNGKAAGGGGAILIIALGPPVDPALAGVTITNSVISGNSATGSGGGLYFNGGGPLTLANVTFSGNSAADNGGGLYSLGGATVALSDSTITGGNSAVLGGGLYLAGVATLTNSTVSGNVATANGGGLYVAGGTKTLTNSTISGNTAATGGGGVYVAGGTTTLNFATVTGNVADSDTNGTGDGGGLAVASGTLAVGNSLVVGNVDKGSQPPDCLGTIVSQGHNLWGEQAVCPNDTVQGDRSLVALGLTAAAALDPMLADNGGPTKTHALALNGPARNAADGGPACTGTGPGQAGGKDQRGIARPQAGGCDSGAYEEIEVILTTGVHGPGGITPATGGHSVGVVVTLVATPANAQSIFTGWTVDGVARGWANPLTITMSASRTVVANFAPVVPFSDVGIGQLFTQPIIELAARGYIKGYGDGTYGPTDQTRRAQMAALIARAMGYSDSPVNPFTDKCDAQNANCVDVELWDRVAELASRTIARGYTDPATCGVSGTPCYAPRDFVLHAQVLSFITRAMVAQGYWVQQPTNTGLYGGVLVGTGHEQDVTTYSFYTQSFGGVPDYPTGGFFPAWEQPATRGWFARALWTALNSYFAVDRVP